MSRCLFCVDYRRLNDVTVKDPYSLPRVDDTLDALGGARYFSTLELCSAYHQLPMNVTDREKTAFSTPDGHYHFNVMPFGVCDGPSSFQLLMGAVLRGWQWHNRYHSCCPTSCSRLRSILPPTLFLVLLFSCFLLPTHVPSCPLFILLSALRSH
eukprot:scpid102411/ scgid8201/ Transposon Ty3-I Gag-Pol polyprotein; Gag3-Pol3; Transposon Ty3-2 TYA-TYB polyprotein; Capsid protein; p24; Spacer peptide p3; Nucleocapsid protein p11; Ty3 protease; p16; Spacer peptide J; Reverse transcriptase/ribonuclease H; p55; Integrase p52; Integrase p49